MPDLPKTRQSRQDRIVARLLAATTAAEIAAAQEAAAAWLARHPDDRRVRFASVQMSLMPDAWKRHAATSPNDSSPSEAPPS